MSIKRKYPRSSPDACRTDNMTSLVGDLWCWSACWHCSLSLRSAHWVSTAIANFEFEAAGSQPACWIGNNPPFANRPVRLASQFTGPATSPKQRKWSTAAHGHGRPEMGA